MLAWVSSISNLFGYILNFIYNLVGNYGIAIILFTMLVKLILAPFTYLQQKGMKKTTLISEELKKVQEKYKGNDKKIQEETMKVYKNNNTSPLASCSSCITVIIQMILILGVFYLVSEPLKYMRKMDTDVYNKYEIRMHEEVIAEKEAEKENKDDNNDMSIENGTDNKENNNIEEKEDDKQEEKTDEQIIKELKVKSGVLRPQMEMISRFRDEDEAFDINTEFLGLDLTAIPTNSIKSFNIKDKDTYIVLTNLIIPILYITVSILNIVYIGKKNKQKQEENKDLNIIEVKAEKPETKEIVDEKSLVKDDSEKLTADDFGDAMADANKSMVYFMPIIMFTVTMNAPLSLALYWFMNTTLSIIEKEIVDKLVEYQDKTGDEKINIAIKSEKNKKK